ncbi:DUF4397 domain-containing protein [Salarchaeum sp. JOR-1]|uniref:DUF4397 domain-containing protein n=1 Tax=Salarchaeum sp. JOR-1 TaxID=2599399 RepID=UPI001198818A|nr:DUF4397 domain-containing protein [Salarchaeum sp. JOR-1]QDX39999.1 DUF4397 domain-containing protein [Salarchaeum sp. JOR-1]
MGDETSRRRFVLAAATALTTGVAGCGTGDTNGTTNGTTDGATTTTQATTDATTEETTTQTASAWLRVAHLSPDAPAVNVLVDGSVALEGVAFGAISDYLSVSPGDHTVAVRTTDGGSTVFEETLTLDVMAYTAAAIGEVSGDSPTFTVAPFVDDPGEVPSDSAAIRLVHASPDAPAVDVAVAGSADDPLFSGVEFGAASDYVAVPTGEYTLEIRPADAQPSIDPVASTTVALESGAWTAFATGYVSPGDEPADAPFDVLLQSDTPPQE